MRLRRVSHSLTVSLLVLVLVGLLTGMPPAAGRKDESTGRIRVLYIGDHGAQSPSPLMDAEPMIDLRVASALFHVKGAQRRRLNRLYFPRTYRDLAAYDAIIISDAPVDQFEDQHYFWFKNSVLLDGCGFVMIGGNGGFGGGPELPWTPTAVQDILPVLCLDSEKAIGRLEIIRPDHELVTSLPLKKRWEWMREYGINKVEPRQEAETLAEVISRTSGDRVPFWAHWGVGEGRCFAVTGDWTPMGGNYFMRWGYYGDFAVHLILYVTRNPLPSDLETVHRARSGFIEFRSTRSYVFSVMDFAEKLGANMNPVGPMLVEADLKHAESTTAYIDQDFEASLGLLAEALEGLVAASERAMQLKDQAMAWIFFAEWATVTGTFGIVAFVLWTLMVRRRLYREIEHTRFVSEQAR